MDISLKEATLLFNLIKVGPAPYNNKFGFQKHNTKSSVYQYDNGWGIHNIGLLIKNTKLENCIINKFFTRSIF